VLLAIAHSLRSCSKEVDIIGKFGVFIEEIIKL